jgi:hypothetical protein
LSVASSILFRDTYHHLSPCSWLFFTLPHLSGLLTPACPETSGFTDLCLSLTCCLPAPVLEILLLLRHCLHLGHTGDLIVGVKTYRRVALQEQGWRALV